MEPMVHENLRHIFQEHGNTVYYHLPDKVLLSVVYNPQYRELKTWEFWVALFFKEPQEDLDGNRERFFLETYDGDTDFYDSEYQSEWTQYFQDLLPEILNYGKIVDASYIRNSYSQQILNMLHTCFMDHAPLSQKQMWTLEMYLRILSDPKFYVGNIVFYSGEFDEQLYIWNFIWGTMEDFGAPLDSIKISI